MCWDENLKKKREIHNFSMTFRQILPFVWKDILIKGASQLLKVSYYTVNMPYIYVS